MFNVGHVVSVQGNNHWMRIRCLFSFVCCRLLWILPSNQEAFIQHVSCSSGNISEVRAWEPLSCETMIQMPECQATINAQMQLSRWQLPESLGLGLGPFGIKVSGFWSPFLCGMRGSEAMLLELRCQQLQLRSSALRDATTGRAAPKSRRAWRRALALKAESRYSTFPCWATAAARVGRLDFRAWLIALAAGTIAAGMAATKWPVPENVILQRMQQRRTKP